MDDVGQVDDKQRPRPVPALHPGVISIFQTGFSSSRRFTMLGYHAMITTTIANDQGWLAGGINTQR